MNLLIGVVVLLSLFTSETKGDYGLVYGRSAGKKDWQTHVCITYNPYIHTLPTTQEQAVNGLLIDFSNNFGCFDSKVYDKTSVAGDIVAVARGNCTFVEKTDMAQQHSAAGVLVISDTSVLPGLNQSSDVGRFKITIGSIVTSQYNKLKNLGSSVELMMYAPVEKDKFDPCMIVIFALAVLCVAVGGFWSGLIVMDRQRRKEERQRKKAQKSSYVQSEADKEQEEEDEKEENLDITIPAVIVFFVLVCTFLVLLYFYYDYLVYVIIALFCIAGSVGLFYCMLPLWNYIPVHQRIPKLPCCKSQPEIKSLVLYGLCAILAIVWAIERHESYAWVLQDILGVAFCINMLKTIQVPNLKICTVLLILLFLYDIFFVFVTPYFTKNGESIMVKVATGETGKSSEKLPMVFVVPKLGSSLYRVCLDQPSMLGFGDIIVPGLLIGYNHGIDLHVNSRRIYYIATVIAYGIGMVITFVALELMKTGQPALLYLVPCTLITTFVIGCIRGEVRLLWNGIKTQTSKNTNNKSSEDAQDGTAPDTVSTSQVDVVVSSSSTIDSENKSLITK